MIKDKKSKNILIGGLLVAVLVMVVAYAALASNLQINGTANVSSTWDVEIISVTPDKTATNSGTAQAPKYTTPGDITHSITNNNLTANFDTALVSPGDTVTYTIVVQNKGTIDAMLNNTTKTDANNPAIIFAVNGLTNGERLNAGASKTFTVVVTYSSSVTAQPASTESTLAVTLNYTQYDPNYIPPAQTVYAINTNNITKNTSTLQDIGTTYNSCSATGKSTCLKYTIENNTVTGAEVCFIKGGTEYCLQGWVDECLKEKSRCTFTGTTTVFNTNKLVLQTAFTENNACSDSGSHFACNASGLYAYADSDGSVNAHGGSWYCYVNNVGGAACFDGG